jgi:hypothetical protein
VDSRRRLPREPDVTPSHNHDPGDPARVRSQVVLERDPTRAVGEGLGARSKVAWRLDPRKPRTAEISAKGNPVTIIV